MRAKADEATRLFLLVLILMLNALPLARGEMFGPRPLSSRPALMVTPSDYVSVPDQVVFITIAGTGFNPNTQVTLKFLAGNNHDQVYVYNPTPVLIAVNPDGTFGVTGPGYYGGPIQFPVGYDPNCGWTCSLEITAADNGNPPHSAWTTFTIFGPYKYGVGMSIQFLF
jgi:hypothetical protein